MADKSRKSISILVAAEQGAGKTTLIKILTEAMKNKGYSYTFVDNGALVEKWVGHGPNVDVYIEEQVEP